MNLSSINFPLERVTKSAKCPLSVLVDPRHRYQYKVCVSKLKVMCFLPADLILTWSTLKRQESWLDTRVLRLCSDCTSAISQVNYSPQVHSQLEESWRFILYRTTVHQLNWFMCVVRGAWCGQLVIPDLGLRKTEELATSILSGNLPSPFWSVHI